MNLPLLAAPKVARQWRGGLGNFNSLIRLWEKSVSGRPRPFTEGLFQVNEFNSVNVPKLIRWLGATRGF